MAKFTIHPQAKIGAVTLNVANLKMMTDFYEEVMGLHRRRQAADGQVVLGASAADILILREHPTGRRVNSATGLYHLAILTPNRASLGDWLKHLARQNYPLDGASDHGVSEAIYLHDPEGNGIEVYCDRPRDQWPLVNDQLQMTVDPLDVNAILQESNGAAWSGLSAGTMLGHIHLKVNDTQAAAEFYVDLLGFDLTQSYPGAKFMSAGGYHHHLGVNTWQSRGAPPPPPEALGLHSFTIQLPDETERARLVERVRAADYPLEDSPAGPLLRDPAGLALVLAV
jgi:catechol 2,3-dioxygenase